MGFTYAELEQYLKDGAGSVPAPLAARIDRLVSGERAQALGGADAGLLVHTSKPELPLHPAELGRGVEPDEGH